MNTVTQIETTSTAIDVVVKAWMQIPARMNNPQADKVWRIKSYLESQQQILVDVVSKDESDSEI